MRGDQNYNMLHGKTSVALQIDKMVLFLILLLATLPFAQVLHLNVGPAILNAYELIYLLLGFFLVSKMIITMKGYHIYPFLFLSSVMIVWTLFSLATQEVNIMAIINQIRVYLPFIIATLLLFAGTRIRYEKYASYLVVATMLSASSALVIHHFVPGFLEQAFKASEEVIAITVVHGRLFWANALVLLIILTFMFLKYPNLSLPKVLQNMTLMVVLLAVLNTLNRTIIIGFFLLLLGIILVQRGRRIRNTLTVFYLTAIGCGVMFFAFSIDARIQHLFELRFLGAGYGVEAIFERAVIIGRLDLYKEYLYRITNNFVFGQGLGLPFSMVAGREVPIVDISLLAFVLPFGIFGLIMFASFIWKLFQVALNADIGINNTRIIVVLLIVSTVVSLNIDLFSRNNFVIFLTYFLLTLKNISSKQTKTIQGGG